MLKAIVKIFEDNKLVKAIARILGLFIAFAAFVSFIASIRDKITPLIVHSTISFVALIICIFSANEILKKLYGKLWHEHRLTQHPFLEYNLALCKSIRLSSIDDSYFISVTWLKFSRVVVSLFLVSFLLLYYEINDHSHRWEVYIFEIKIIVHEILDYIIVTGILSLSCFALWQIYEINIISSGTARFVNNRRKRLLRRLRADSRNVTR